MVEQEPVKDVKKPSGLEDDDVWGDEAEDPADEMARMTDAELVAKTADLESQLK